MSHPVPLCEVFRGDVNPSMHRNTEEMQLPQHTTHIVFIIDKPKSHLLASMGLARRLQSRGFRVEYWGMSQIRETVVAQGFTFRALSGLWPRYPDDLRLPPGAGLLQLLTSPRLLTANFRLRRQAQKKLGLALAAFRESLVSLIAEHPAALIVFDPFLLAYYPYVKSLRVPVAVLSTKPVPIRDPLVPPHTSYLVPQSTPIGRLLVEIDWLRARLIDWTLRGAHKMAHWLGAYTHETLVAAAAADNRFCLRTERVRRWVEPDLNFRSVSEWALWTADFDLPRQNPLPPSVYYVGPCVDAQREEPLAKVAQRRPGSHLIYVAVGTVRFRWQSHVPFLRKVIEAFADLPNVSVMMSTGDPCATAALGATPTNIAVHDFLPQLRMISAADLVITHGGAGTIRECVLRAVPMLVYPAFHDQMGNAARVVYHGLGMRGRRQRDSAEDIRKKAFAILNDGTYRTNLQRIRHRIEQSQSDLLTEALRAALGERDLARTTQARRV